MNLHIDSIKCQKIAKNTDIRWSKMTGRYLLYNRHIYVRKHRCCSIIMIMRLSNSALRNFCVLNVPFPFADGSDEVITITIKYVWYRYTFHVFCPKYDYRIMSTSTDSNAYNRELQLHRNDRGHCCTPTIENGVVNQLHIDETRCQNPNIQQERVTGVSNSRQNSNGLLVDRDMPEMPQVSNLTLNGHQQHHIVDTRHHIDQRAQQCHSQGDFNRYSYQATYMEYEDAHGQRNMQLDKEYVNAPQTPLSEMEEDLMFSYGRYVMVMVGRQWHLHHQTKCYGQPEIFAVYHVVSSSLCLLLFVVTRLQTSTLCLYVVLYVDAACVTYHWAWFILVFHDVWHAMSVDISKDEFTNCALQISCERCHCDNCWFKIWMQIR